MGAGVGVVTGALGGGAGVSVVMGAGVGVVTGPGVGVVTGAGVVAGSVAGVAADGGTASVTGATAGVGVGAIGLELTAGRRRGAGVGRAGTATSDATTACPALTRTEASRKPGAETVAVNSISGGTWRAKGATPLTCAPTDAGGAISVTIAPGALALMVVSNNVGATAVAAAGSTATAGGAGSMGCGVGGCGGAAATVGCSGDPWPAVVPSKSNENPLVK